MLLKKISADQFTLTLKDVSFPGVVLIQGKVIELEIINCQFSTLICPSLGLISIRISSCPRLVRLIANNNRLYHLFLDTDLDSLKELDLSFNNLRSIPRDRMKNLKEICLESNRLLSSTSLDLERFGKVNS